MKQRPGESESAGRRGRILAQLPGIAAVAAASVMIVSLGVRPIGGHDVGYHLAYGEHFLDHGRIVQTNRFIYTDLKEHLLDRPDNVGPGCRYDPDTGTYSFVNANWLSQVLIAAVHRAGGMVALSLLQAAIVAAIFGVLIVTLRRGGVGWHWIASAVMLGALTAHERFALRPELLGYLLLVGQFALLVGPRFGRASAIGVIALQVLAVNCHSYFLMGIALSAAMFADALLRWLWASTVTGADTSPIRPRLKWLGLAAGGTVLASLCNPWFLRGAVMPVQTIRAVRSREFLALTLREGPQRQVLEITELSSPFDERWAALLSTKAYKVALGLAVAGALACLARRRWGWLLALIGVTLASLSMRRNIALAGILAVPLAAMAMQDGWRRLSEKLRPARAGRLIGPLRAAVALAAIAGGVFWTRSVVTHKLYFSERNRGRFALGAMEVSLPLDAAGWITAHRPAGRVFCDFTTSSNLMYFTTPHPDVPALTNTWAYPPSVLQWIIDCATDPAELARAVEKYGVGTIVLNPSPLEQPVVEYLASSPDWAVVEIGPKYVVFVRRKANPGLAAAGEITESSLDVRRHVQRIRQMDPVAAHALHSGAEVLFWMGWLEAARAVWEKCIELDGTFHEALYHLGLCAMKRGLARSRAWAEHLDAGRQAEAADAWREADEQLGRAEAMMEDALRIESDYAEAKADLRVVRRLRAVLQRRRPPAAAP